jgi:hypothetical protein
MTNFLTALNDALGPDLAFQGAIEMDGTGALPSLWAVSDLAAASIAVAGAEMAALTHASRVRVDRRLASFWFDMTLRPQGWTLPGVWDEVAGDYPTADGWIRLHTNAPHHKVAALSALGCSGARDVVAEAVAGWSAQALQDAVVAAGGCAAAMHSVEEWAVHPQGKAVAKEPLIAWSQISDGGRVSPTPTGLRGVRVLDLTRILAGPVATRFLAGFGAEVLRIDPLDWEEAAAAPEVTLGKRCAGLDLRTIDGRATFLALLKDADVLVHGYRSDALENLGLGATVRHVANPNCIDVSLCAYGWTGPWAARRGFDSLVQMSCGIASAGMKAAMSDRPVPLPVQALDHATGYIMAAAVVRALRVRAQTGVVQAAHLSLARTACLLMEQGVQPSQDAFDVETERDFGKVTEQTVWGAARRLHFPMTLDGSGPTWPCPAGPLKRDVASWSLPRQTP